MQQYVDRYVINSLFSDNMATILVTGGTGLVGKALTRQLTSLGHNCIVLSRNPAPAKEGIRYAAWNPDAGTMDEASLQAADYIIHLAGAGVADQRWSAARKKEILDSRVKSGELLVKKLASIPHKVKAVISASAIGWYGADPEIPNPDPFTEERPPDTAFGRYLPAMGGKPPATNRDGYPVSEAADWYCAEQAWRSPERVS